MGSRWAADAALHQNRPNRSNEALPRTRGATMSTQDRRSAVVVTVSDGVARGVREDASGGAVATLLETSGFVVTGREVVPDEADQIGSLLRRLRDQDVPLVVTT